MAIIDYEILKKFGSTKERLKEIWTATPITEVEKAGMTKDEIDKREADIRIRLKQERRIRERLEEAITVGMKNYRLFAASDLAWDAAPVTPSMIPLLLYAQGKINVSNCAGQLEKLDPQYSSQYVKKKEGKVVGIDLPKFFNVNINLVRHFITRRLAAQSNKFNNVWPYYYFEPRSTSLVAKLRSDALSQRVDIMSDQYDWRHHDVQCMRDMFLYTNVVDFVRSSWEKEKHWQKKPKSAEFTPPSGEFEVEEVITREGLCFLNPHPSRVFRDRAYPWSSINADNGISYCGFWDITRYGAVAGNQHYYNRESIAYSQSLWGIYGSYTNYFNQYFDQITPPPNCDCGPNASTDVAGQNDLKNNLGFYSANTADSAIFLAEFYEKIIPKDIGCGDYPYPVWIRFTVASDNTIIYSEIMPSTPAACLSLNSNDSRESNISFAHELMPFQDQMTNLCSQMLNLCQMQGMKIIAINTDLVREKEERDAIKAHFKGDSWGSRPVVLEYSYSDKAELGTAPGGRNPVVDIHETKVADSINVIFQSMLELLSLIERMVAMSPAEQGQPAPRQISATEVNEIANTTTSVYSFISDAIDEWRAAKKRIIYESLLACADDNVKVPVVNRYSRKTVEAAGFQVVDSEDEDYSDPDVKKRTIIGSKQNLRYEYIFNSRDGAERAVNVQAANTLVQMLGTFLPIPGFIDDLGKERLFQIANEIMRMSGAGYDLKLEMQEGEENQTSPDQLQQITEMLNQVAESVKKNSQDIQQQTAVNENQEAAIKATTELAGMVKKSAQDIQRIQAKMVEPKPHQVSESLSYKDAPPSIKAQIEQQAGMIPASMAERLTTNGSE